MNTERSGHATVDRAGVRRRMSLDLVVTQQAVKLNGIHMPDHLLYVTIIGSIVRVDTTLGFATVLLNEYRNLSHP